MLQEGTGLGTQFFCCKENEILNDPILMGQLAARGKEPDRRREEIDRCISFEGDGVELSLGSMRALEVVAPHAPAQHSVLLPPSHALAGVGVSDACGGHPLEINGPQLSNGLGGSNQLFEEIALASVSLPRGVQHQNLLPSNHHIRFLSDESERLEFSDSIKEFVGDEYKILKMRQKNRKKKKVIYLAKKHMGPVLQDRFEGSPKLWKDDKFKYQVCSTHRRITSQPLGREEVWSEEEEVACGNSRGGWRGAHSQGSGIGLMFMDNVDLVEETQERNEDGGRKKLKILAAKKVLHTQKKAGVTFSKNEGGIIDKLVELEDK